MESVLKGNSTSTNRNSTSTLCEAWKAYQERRWPDSAVQEHIELQKMGIVVSLKQVRHWRKYGALPKNDAWTLILKLGWPFLVEVMGEALADSVNSMETQYEEREERNARAGKVLLAVLSGHSNDNGRGGPRS